MQGVADGLLNPHGGTRVHRSVRYTLPPKPYTPRCFTLPVAAAASGPACPPRSCRRPPADRSSAPRECPCSDGLAAARTLQPPKSNWARAIGAPPFLAYPLVGAVAYTFGGLATDDRARVLRDGAPIPGLFAAGEITGHFYATAPNAVSVLRAFVFGRIAGREAVGSLGAV